MHSMTAIYYLGCSFCPGRHEDLNHNKFRKFQKYKKNKILQSWPPSNDVLKIGTALLLTVFAHKQHVNFFKPSFQSASRSRLKLKDGLKKIQTLTNYFPPYAFAFCWLLIFCLSFWFNYFKFASLKMINGSLMWSIIFISTQSQRFSLISAS